jgi:hypothetical protein
MGISLDRLRFPDIILLLTYSQQAYKFSEVNANISADRVYIQKQMNGDIM